MWLTWVLSSTKPPIYFYQCTKLNCLQSFPITIDVLSYFLPSIKDLEPQFFSNGWFRKYSYCSLIEIYWGLSTAKYSSASHSLFTGTPVLHFPDCSGKVKYNGVPLKRECEVLEYLAVLSPQYISVSVLCDTSSCSLVTYSFNGGHRAYGCRCCRSQGNWCVRYAEVSWSHWCTGGTMKSGF